MENILLGVCRKIFFLYNFTDIIKFIILFHLQRLGAHNKVSRFSNFWKIKWRKIDNSFPSLTFLSTCLLYCVILSGNRWKIIFWKTLLYAQLNSQQTYVRFNLVGQKLWEKIPFQQPKVIFLGERKNTSKQINMNYMCKIYNVNNNKTADI